MITLPKGVNCTMLAAYKENMTLDFTAQEKMLDWYCARGVKSFFAMCHSTEQDLMTMQERLEMVRFVRSYTDSLASSGQPCVPVIAAGTFSTDLQEMAGQIQNMYEAGASAVVLITNRLDPANEGGDTFIRNGESLLKLIPEDLPLGMYECPNPYKRVLTNEEMQWAVDTKRIHFLKDTCCDPILLKERMDIVRGSALQLFNANAQTLLMTLRLGASGYSSCMANEHPQLYAWLCDHYEQYPELADRVQQIICFTAMVEVLEYPLSAKYLMKKQGVPVQINSRRHPGCSGVTPYAAHIMDQLESLTDSLLAELPR